MIDTTFHENIESIQYNAALAVTGAVRGTFRKKLYQELDFESLQQRRFYRNLCCSYTQTKDAFMEIFAVHTHKRKTLL